MCRSHYHENWKLNNSWETLKRLTKIGNTIQKKLQPNESAPNEVTLRCSFTLLFTFQAKINYTIHFMIYNLAFLVVFVIWISVETKYEKKCHYKSSQEKYPH